MQLDGPFDRQHETPAEVHLRLTLDEAQSPAPFALIDGALYDDLRPWVQATGFRAQMLFLPTDTDDLAATGPWIAPLDDAAQVAGVAALCGADLVPVLCDWPGDARALHDHLRRLTLIEVPDARLMHDTTVHYATAAFRFWDPQVLVTVWPILTPVQQRRIVPPGAGLALVVPGTGERLWLEPPPDPPRPEDPRQGRHLRLTPGQMDAIDDAMRAPGHDAAVADLRRMLQAGGIPPDEARLREAVQDADWMADRLALHEQDSLVALAAWQVIHGRGSRAYAALVDAVLAPGAPGTPDDRLFAHMAAVDLALSRRGGPA